MLYATDMPGVLTEIGFLSNSQEAAYMKSEKGQTEIARSIYEGVKNYSAYVLETRNAEEEAAAAPKPGAETGASGRRQGACARGRRERRGRRTPPPNPNP